MKWQSATFNEIWKRSICTLSVLCFLFYAIVTLSSCLVPNRTDYSRALLSCRSASDVSFLRIFTAGFSTEAYHGRVSLFIICLLFLNANKLLIPPGENTTGIDAPMPTARIPWAQIFPFLFFMFFTFLNRPQPVNRRQLVHEFHLVHSGSSPPVV